MPEGSLVVIESNGACKVFLKKVARFIVNPGAALEIKADDSSSNVFVKSFACCVVNFLYAFAVRGDVFSSIVLGSYLITAIDNKKIEASDFDFTNSIIAGGIITTVLIILETIKRYADQIEQKQLEQKQDELQIFNARLENHVGCIDRLHMDLPLIVHCRKNVAVLNPEQYARYEFPAILPLRLPILDEYAALNTEPILAPLAKKKYFATAYKILVGLVQVFPKSVIASLLFSYLFTLKILKDDPFTSFHLISSVLLACITGIFIILLNLSQRSGAETMISDEQQNILSLGREIQLHGQRLTVLKTQWDQLVRDYQSVSVQQQETLHLQPQDATAAASLELKTLSQKVSKLNQGIAFFNRGRNVASAAAMQETEFGINGSQRDADETTRLLGEERRLASIL